MPIAPSNQQLQQNYADQIRKQIHDLYAGPPPSDAAPAFRFLHLFVGGFTQPVGTLGNGTYRAFLEASRQWSSPDTLVLYAPWYLALLHGPDAIARLVLRLNRARLRVGGSPIRIFISGYSYGGQTAATICHRLANLKINVDKLILCDPVARRNKLDFLRALNPSAKITVPHNVRHVVWIRQNNPRFRLKFPFFFPAGHDVECQGYRTQISGPYTIKQEHIDADNSQEYFEAVRAHAFNLHSANSGKPGIRNSEFGTDK